MGRVKKKTSISPRQLWARRRNYEKRQMGWIFRELNFRKDVRWVKADGRSQTQTDSEIETITKAIKLFEDMLQNWDRNTGIRRNEINFNQYK